MEQYIRFKNGEELPCLGVQGQLMGYEGTQRDHLIFLFDPELVTVAKVAEEFTPDNCASITIIQDGEEHVHNYYNILLGYGYANRNKVINEPIVSSGGDGTQQENPEPEMVVYAKMVQSTALERNLAVQGEVLEEVVEYLMATESGVARMSTRGLEDIMEKLKGR